MGVLIFLIVVVALLVVVAIAMAVKVVKQFEKGCCSVSEGWSGLVLQV